MTAYFSTIWQYRHFWLSLVLVDLRLRYRRSILGVGWSLLMPILMTVIFCMVFGSLHANANWRTYAPWFLCGLSIWQFVTSSAIAGCSTFFRNESYIRQCPLPLTVYSLRTALGTTIHFGIAFALTIVSAVILAPADKTKSLTILWAVVPALLLLVAFAWALSVVTGFLTVYFQDTQQLVEVFVQIFFFLTPVMYTRSFLDEKNMGFLADWNPVAMFLDVVREPLLSGVPPSLVAVEKAVAAAVLMTALAAALTAWLERRLIFKL